MDINIVNQMNIESDNSCVVNTVLDFPSSSKGDDHCYIWYNVGDAQNYVADRYYRTFFSRQDNTQELVLDVSGYIELSDGYQLSSVYNNSLTMYLRTDRGMVYYQNEILKNGKLLSCFTTDEQTGKLLFDFPNVWNGIVPTKQLSIEDTAELVCQFALCFLCKRTGEIVKETFHFSNIISTEDADQRACHVPLLVMVWGTHSC